MVYDVIQYNVILLPHELLSCGICCRRVSVCYCLSVSVTMQSSTDMAKCRIVLIMPHSSPGSVVFWFQRSLLQNLTYILHCTILCCFYNF